MFGIHVFTVIAVRLNFMRFYIILSRKKGKSVQIKHTNMHFKDYRILNNDIFGLVTSSSFVFLMPHF